MMDCERKVNAVNYFHPRAKPTNAEALGLEEDADLAEVPTSIHERMDLHRAVLRGNGFFDWMIKPAAADNDGRPDTLAAMNLQDDGNVSKRRKLPVVNFLSGRDQDGQYTAALLEEALPQDRARYRCYLSECALGIGIMAAGPGFGKTTGAAIAALAMNSSLGKILVSAPSNVAVCNFADRIDRISIRVAARCNKDKSADDPTRARHRLIVRGFKLDTELAAFKRLLENPATGELPVGDSEWQFHLSLTYWALSLLGGGSHISGTRALDPDESESVTKIRQQFQEQAEYDHLRVLLDGGITYQQYASGSMVKAANITALMIAILERADMLCTTPAATDYEPFRSWKNGQAEGIAIDEAANMHRADLYSVWGNTLLPAFLIGDPKQLAPAVLTKGVADADGNFFNRLVHDGGISALGFLQASGIPVFRLKCQLRMGRGLFDIIAKEIYPDVPFTYGESCDVSLPGFATGHLLETYIQQTYPKVSPPPAGTLSPLFLNCAGSRVWADPRSGSKKSYDQVKIALDFAVALIKSKHGKAEDIVILSPYAANIEAVATMRRKQPEYTATLLNMPESSTVDGYQGRENDIVIVVMGTSKSTGPGFMCTESRLNVMLTRQRCGLVIIGELEAVGPLKVKAGAKSAIVKSLDGEGNLVMTRAGALRNVYRALKESGRVANVKIARKK
ncbi:hypothetical protein ACHAQA_007098 [Verticillium albo-atrum]